MRHIAVICAVFLSVLWDVDYSAAQPRIRFRGAAAAQPEASQPTAPNGRDTLDPYARPEGSATPSVPDFGGSDAGEGANSTNSNWFGFPGADAEGGQRRPLWSGSLFGGSDDDPFRWEEFWSGADRLSLGFTWIHGGAGRDSVDVLDFDMGLPLEMGEFFQTDQPWYLIPSFGLHLWDGPGGDADLPARAYSAALQAYYRGDPQQRMSAELGLGVGVYTDFRTLTGHSLRITGEGLLHLRLTPDTVISGGVWYLGRSRIQMLPAVGLLWTPNPQTRWNLFFPQPKLSQYLTTLDEQDVWWYLGGEYGGGSWTIKRAGGFSDRVDIGDVRLRIGLEWGTPKQMETGQRVGFIEGGVSFDREVRYVVTPQDSIGPGSTVFFRVGVGF